MPDRHDDDLAAELRSLGAWLTVPEPADQRAPVRARLTRRARLIRRSRRRGPRWWAASAVAALVGTVAAVAPARAAVVDAVEGLLRVSGIEVRQEPRTGLPDRPSPLPSSRTAALDEARRMARFPVRVPAALGTPGEVLVADPDGTGAPRVVTFTYRGGAVRFDQFDGELSPAYLKAAPDARWVGIGPASGIWLPGPHPVTYVDRDGVERTETGRLAAPTLIWSADGVTYRLEGLPASAQAQAVALSLE
jgi:hypothetical protein